MPEKLTNTSVSKLKAADKPYEVRDAGQKGLLVRVQPNGRKYFYFHLELPPDAAGRRKRARFKLGEVDGAMSVDIARAKATEIMAEHHRGEEPATKRKAINTNTFRAFLEDVYRPWLQVNLQHGEYAYTTLINAFGDFLDRPLVDITPGALESWRTKRLQEANTKTGQPLNPNTINRQLSDLKACLHRARDIWELDICERIDKVKPCKIDSSPKVRYLSADEEHRLRAALDAREQDIRNGTIVYALRKGPRFAYATPDELQQRTFVDYLKPAVLVSLNTGVREGELLKLTWDNVDFDRALLTVAGSTSKTGKTRHVPLNAEALSILRGWKNQPGIRSVKRFVFPAIDGEPMSGIGHSWEKLLKRANIQNFRWHDLRHTFASKLVMAGENLNTVRELLGHSDYKMTLRYAHLAPEHKAAAVAKLCISVNKVAT